MPTAASIAAYVLLLVVVAIAGWTDWTTHKIYNRLTVPAMAAGLLLWSVAGFAASGWPGAGDGFLHSFWSLLAGFVPSAAVFFLLGGLGGGDVYLLGAIGAISARWEVVLGVAVYGLIIGAVMALA